MKLVVSEGTKGLLPALDTHLPEAQLRRCTVHKIRGFECYLRYRHLPEIDQDTRQNLSKEEARHQRRKEIKTDAYDISKAPTKDQAQQRLDAFNEKWQPIEPEAVRNFNWGIKRCFTFYGSDANLHRLIHSTNLIEHFSANFGRKSMRLGPFRMKEAV